MFLHNNIFVKTSQLNLYFKTFKYLSSNKIFNNYFSTTSDSAKKTCLYDYHVKKNGKMVNFAGFLMPVNYADQSIKESHLHTRRSASLFDVSHMLQMIIKGKDSIDFIESVTVGDVKSLNNNTGTLTLYTNDNGGIIDDLIVNKINDDYLYIVSNAGRIEQDLEHVNNSWKKFKSSGNKDVAIEIISDKALLALQGPLSSQCLQSLIKDDLSKIYFMNTFTTSICHINDCRITRCGYTGEDGFEISVPENKVEDLVDILLSNSNIKLAGLGCRDTLRLEAGLCLYGNDIDESTTPIEAGLTWTISKRRRELKNFPGAVKILEQIKNKPSKRRVGMIASTNGPPVRHGGLILDRDSNQNIGHVTSGSPSPSLNKNIAMCYVPVEYSKLGTKLICDVRGKHIQHEVVKMPFIQTKYYIEKK